MPLVAVAICPHPPVIVPEVAGAAADELDELRRACADAIDRLLAADPQTILLLGTGERTRDYGPDAHGSLRPYGLELSVSLSPSAEGGPPGTSAAGGRPELPLSLLIGAWLLRRSGTRVPRWGRAVARTESVADCRRLGAELLDRLPTGVAPDSRVGLLVLGDGTACRGPQAPGYHDPRAESYDGQVAAALAAPDPVALLDLDVALADQLQVSGRAAWQVLAAAVQASAEPWGAELMYHAAPYGVGYFVASWMPVTRTGTTSG